MLSSPSGAAIPAALVDVYVPNPRAGAKMPARLEIGFRRPGFNMNCRDNFSGTYGTRLAASAGPSQGGHKTAGRRPGTVGSMNGTWAT
jgi:hypothetical protein